MHGFLTHNAKELLEIQRKQRKSKRTRVSRRFKQRLFWRDGGQCIYCYKPLRFDEATIDHIMPLTHRGRHRAKENMGIACYACNHRKGPLVMENPGDLAPEMLWLKFKQTYEAVQTRKGSYVKWVASFATMY